MQSNAEWSNHSEKRRSLMNNRMKVDDSTESLGTSLSIGSGEQCSSTIVDIEQPER